MSSNKQNVLLFTAYLGRLYPTFDSLQNSGKITALYNHLHK